uniref:Mobile element protein n=1 Tax=Leclercia adecarboxylata TaxID=83655 RepID=A0A7D5FWK8_9ENTR|nr:Mobile element protein [Leclercia adecarboxylata]
MLHLTLLPRWLPLHLNPLSRIRFGVIGTDAVYKILVFQLQKRERIKKKIYGTREEACSEIFDYIEMFYISKRRHGSSD